MVAHMRRNEILLQGILSLRSKIDIKTDDIWAYEKDWSHCCHPIDSLTNFWPKHEITCKFLHTVPHITGYKLTGEVCIWSAIGAKGLILHLSRHLCHHFVILVFTCICSVSGLYKNNRSKTVDLPPLFKKDSGMKVLSILMCSLACSTSYFLSSISTVWKQKVNKINYKQKESPYPKWGTSLNPK